MTLQLAFKGSQSGVDNNRTKAFTVWVNPCGLGKVAGQYAPLRTGVDERTLRCARIAEIASDHQR